MQGVAQLTTGFSNKYDCDMNQLISFLQLFYLYFEKKSNSKTFRDGCVPMCVSSLDINNSVFLSFNEFMWFEYYYL